MRWQEGTSKYIFESPKVWETFEKHPYNWAVRGTQEQLDTINKECKKYPHNPDWCGMLIKEEDKYCCIIHKLYGEEVKPLECVRYGEFTCMNISRRK